MRGGSSSAWGSKAAIREALIWRAGLIARLIPWLIAGLARLLITRLAGLETRLARLAGLVSGLAWLRASGDARRRSGCLPPCHRQGGQSDHLRDQVLRFGRIPTHSP